MSKEFVKKVVLITGASSGIGAGTAIHLSTLGATLSLIGRNMDNLQKVANKCTTNESKPHLIQADMTKEADIQKIMASTIKHCGKLDVLINNAGIFETGSLQQSTLDQYDRILNTNLRSMYQLTKLAIPHLEATKGNILNVSSISGLKAFYQDIAYSVSKSGVDQFTKCVARELAPKQIRVNSVNPGVIATEIFARGGLSQKEIDEYFEKVRNELHPLRRVGQVDDVAKAIAFLISDRASFITGVQLSVDGGWQLVCPR